MAANIAVRELREIDIQGGEAWRIALDVHHATKLQAGHSFASSRS
jgi:hypothetical protein